VELKWEIYDSQDLLYRGLMFLMVDKW